METTGVKRVRLSRLRGSLYLLSFSFLPSTPFVTVKEETNYSPNPFLRRDPAETPDPDPWYLPDKTQKDTKRGRHQKAGPITSSLRRRRNEILPLKFPPVSGS